MNPGDTGLRSQSSVELQGTHWVEVAFALPAGQAGRLLASPGRDCPACGCRRASASRATEEDQAGRPGSSPQG